jgi:hypothetical protein
MIMIHENIQDNDSSLESKIVEISKKILEGEVDLLVGCRQLNPFRFKTEKFRELLLPISGIVSETDDFLIGNERLGSSSDFLFRMDRERDKYLQKVKSIIVETCQAIVNES